MTESIKDTLYYIHGGRLIKKTTWGDERTGDSWDTFDDQGGNFDWLPDGTVVDPANIESQPGGDPARDEGEDRQDLGSPGMAYNYGSNQPSSNFQSTAPPNPSTQRPQQGSMGSSGGGYATLNSGSNSMPDNQQQPNAFNRQITQQGNPGDPGMADRIRNLELFDPTQPGAAMQQAMLGAGMNPFMSSMMNRFMMRAAPGLANSFMMEGASSANPGSAMDVGGSFKDYLDKALGGGMDVFGTLGNAAQSLPEFASYLRDQSTQGSLMQQNPYANYMFQNLQSPNSIINALLSLNGAGMPTQMARSYQGGLQNAAVGSLSRAGVEDDIFKYLLGV